VINIAYFVADTKQREMKYEWIHYLTTVTSEHNLKQILDGTLRVGLSPPSPNLELHDEVSPFRAPRLGDRHSQSREDLFGAVFDRKVLGVDNDLGAVYVGDLDHYPFLQFFSIDWTTFPVQVIAPALQKLVLRLF
jgi:hypothetical protein